MNCPKCQSESHEKAKFCSECGYDIRRSKKALFEEDHRSQSYTPKFLADKILNTKSAIEGERKIVTVLFADVAGYTSISEKLDPEEIHYIMDGCFKILMDEIHRYEGTVNQFRGDGMMAIFGAPIAHEDHAKRACDAALIIQEALKRYGGELKRKFGVNFKMRMGLNSGPVVVGSIGDDLRMDYTADGDITNVASRLEDMADPGSVLVSKNTQKKVSPYFEFTPLGRVTVKGKTEPVEIFRLENRRYMPELGFDRRIQSEMVGRDNELHRLELQVMKAINGEGSVVNIIGEAGIGKSRLMAELKKRELIKRVNLIEGRGISIGRNLSFHPIIDIFKQWARIRDDDGEAAAFNKLETAIRSLYPEKVGEVFPFVATIMGMKLSGRYAARVKGIEGEALEKLILKHIREILIKLAERTPLVIVIEDFHWADTSSIEFLESLFRLAETQRILFVNVFRPGHKETGDRILETINKRLPVYYVEIMLEPLDERMSETLITSMLNISGLEHAFVDKVIERAGGNPFFIEEVVRSFIDDGAVVMRDGTFEVTEKIGTMSIPYTINDVLMARIDRLHGETRDLVKVASVIGRNFFYRILVQVADTIKEIDFKLLHLKEIQLIRERRRMEELEYLFKHALAQEAAYESILASKRKALHLKVAGSIEKVFSERFHEFYGMLAYHYSRAENHEKAEEYLVKAGEEALKSSASIEALNYYKEALELYVRQHGDAGDPNKRAMLEKNIAIALYNKFQYVKAIEYFDSVLDHRGVGSPKNKILMAVKLIFNLLSVVTNLYFPSKKARKIPEKRDNELFDLIQKRVISLIYVDHIRFLFETLVLLGRLNRFDVTKIENGVSMYAGASALFSFTGISFKLSKRALETAKVAINKNDFKAVFYYELFEIMHNCLKGNWDNIKECDENLLDLNLGIGEFWNVATYFHFLGVMKMDRGEFKETEDILRKLHELSETYENENFFIGLFVLKAKYLLKCRKLQDALAEVDAGIAFDIQTGVELQHIFLLGFKALICILSKDIDGAKHTLSQAKAIQLIKGRVPPFFISSYLMSRFLFDLFLLEESILSQDKSNISKYRKKAYQSGKKALSNSFKHACDRTEAMRLMGSYNWLIGNQHKASKWWNKSVAEGKRLGARVELARTYMEIGKRFLKKESGFHELNGIKAEEYLERAGGLFEEMNLQWDLEELEAVIADR